MGMQEVSPSLRMGQRKEAIFTSGAVTCDGRPLLHIDTNQSFSYTFVCNIVLPDESEEVLTEAQKKAFRGVYICPQTGVEVRLPHGAFLLHQGSDTDVGFHGGGLRLGDDVDGIAFRRYMVAQYLKDFR